MGKTARPPLPGRAPDPHPRLSAARGPAATPRRRRRLHRQAQPRLAAAADHRVHHRHRRPAPADQPPLDQHRPHPVHPADQLPAARAVRPSPLRQRPPDGHRPALRPVHPHAAALHRLPLPCQRRRAPGQGRARRGDGRADGPADRRDRTRRDHRAHRRTRHHRRPHPRVPPRLPRRGARRRAPRGPAPRATAHAQRALPARGGDPVVPGDGDDAAHPRHPGPRPRGQRAAPHERHPEPAAHLRSPPRPGQRPVRVAGLGRPQRRRRAGPGRCGTPVVPRRLGRHRRRRRDAQRLPDHPHQLHDYVGRPRPGHHQGPGVRPFGGRGPPGSRTGGQRGQGRADRPAGGRHLRAGRLRLRDRRAHRRAGLHPRRRAGRDHRPGGRVRRGQVAPT
ncbi:hypothetical protein QFZ55_007767 [Streptomyces luteogriseus]|nr:hypothetical protein [Streptomyces luteogriseus]